MKKLKKVHEHYFAKKQSRGDDQEKLEKACTTRGGVWNKEDQVCYGIKEGKKRPIDEKN